MSLEHAKDLFLYAHSQYMEALNSGRPDVAAYWNGYIRGMAHVLNNTSLSDS